MEINKVNKPKKQFNNDVNVSNEYFVTYWYSENGNIKKKNEYFHSLDEATSFYDKKAGEINGNK